MRPDPYKRARSRQYKAKHGILDTIKIQNSESNLPTNISEEQLSLLAHDLDEENEELCLNLDDDNFSAYLKGNSIPEKYKYPKYLYEEILNCDPAIGNDPVVSHVSYLAHKLSLPERFFYENECVLKIQNEPPETSSIYKRPNVLELRKEAEESLTTSPVLKKSPEAKIALEDWLDEVL